MKFTSYCGYRCAWSSPLAPLWFPAIRTCTTRSEASAIHVITTVHGINRIGWDQGRDFSSGRSTPNATMPWPALLPGLCQQRPGYGEATANGQCLGLVHVPWFRRWYLCMSPSFCSAPSPLQAPWFRRWRSPYLRMSPGACSSPPAGIMVLKVLHRPVSPLPGTCIPSPGTCSRPAHLTRRPGCQYADAHTYGQCKTGRAKLTSRAPPHIPRSHHA